MARNRFHVKAARIHRNGSLLLRLVHDFLKEFTITILAVMDLCHLIHLAWR
jgi:hypothetical protein